jgi:peptidoglycan/LPS O-acetylase OafA/YrhL
VDGRSFLIAAAAGTLLQVGMVVGGHQVAAIKPYFGPGGMAISLAAGLLYALLAPAAAGWAATLGGGALAGGVCAFLGIALSHTLGDVPLALLAFGTLGSAAAGLVGAAIGKLVG